VKLLGNKRDVAENSLLRLKARDKHPQQRIKAGCGRADKE